MTPLRTGLTTFLAAPPTPPPGKGAEWGKAAPIGLLILVLLGVALYLLIKSMNRHMRKVSGLTSFDAADGPTADATSNGPTDGARPATATAVVTGSDGPHPRPESPSDDDQKT